MSAIQTLELCLLRQFLFPVELRVKTSKYLYLKLQNETIHKAVVDIQDDRSIGLWWWGLERIPHNDEVIKKYGHITYWDTSEVTTMNSLFKMMTCFNFDISRWDVSNVTDMSHMFLQATYFNKNLNSWNVSSVTTMENMFALASSFNQPLHNWNVSSVTNMSFMFDHASDFNQPIEEWDVSNVTTMRYMFRRASTFNQHLQNWNCSETVEVYGVLSEASNFRKLLPPLWEQQQFDVLRIHMPTLYKKKIKKWCKKYRRECNP